MEKEKPETLGVTPRMALSGIEGAALRFGASAAGCCVLGAVIGAAIGGAAISIGAAIGFVIGSAASVADFVRSSRGE